MVCCSVHQCSLIFLIGLLLNKADQVGRFKWTPCNFPDHEDIFTRSDKACESMKSLFRNGKAGKLPFYFKFPQGTNSKLFILYIPLFRLVYTVRKSFAEYRYHYYIYCQKKHKNAN